MYGAKSEQKEGKNQPQMSPEARSQIQVQTLEKITQKNMQIWSRKQQRRLSDSAAAWTSSEVGESGSGGGAGPAAVRLGKWVMRCGRCRG